MAIIPCVVNACLTIAPCVLSNILLFMARDECKSLFITLVCTALPKCLCVCACACVCTYVYYVYVHVRVSTCMCVCVFMCSACVGVQS